MPEIDGFELADMMRQHPRFQKTPIIFVSAVHLSDLGPHSWIPERRGGLYLGSGCAGGAARQGQRLCGAAPQEASAAGLNRDLEERVAQRSEELRLLNEQLQQRVAELESIMQVLPVGVAVAHGQDCKTITGNAALGEMLGSGARRKPVRSPR